MLIDPATYPFTRVLESRWRDIQREFDALPTNHFFDWYEPDAFTGQWRMCGLYAREHPQMNRLSPETVRRCPQTVALVSAIPDVNIALFSLLGPHSIVYPHRDIGPPSVRCHLGLHIPDGAQFKTEDTVASWTAGKCLMFDSRSLHAAWNQSNEPRALLVVEIWRGASNASDSSTSAAAESAAPSANERGQ